jgi:hypothetical protein
VEETWRRLAGGAFRSDLLLDEGRWQVAGGAVAVGLLIVRVNPAFSQPLFLLFFVFSFPFSLTRPRCPFSL